MNSIRLICLTLLLTAGSQNVFAQDTIPPVAELIGDTVICIERGDTYVDSGLTVTDNFYEFADLTITVEQSFLGDSIGQKLGCHCLRYKVQDPSGNVVYTGWRCIMVRPKGDTTPCIYSEGACKRLAALAIEDREPEFIQAYIYPNPANARATLIIKNQNMKRFTVSLLDITGRVIRQLGTPAEKMEINTAELLPGYYLVLVNSDEGSKVLQLSVAK